MCILLENNVSCSLGFQDSDDIVPETYEDEACLGNLKECIMLSGFGLLSAHFELSRFALTKNEIVEGNKLLKAAKLQLFRLEAYKARILNVRGLGSRQIKQHISGHFFEDWANFAARHIDDTSLTEATHKLVKSRFRAGSKRTLEASSEMYDRFQCAKVMGHAYAEFETKLGTEVPHL